MVLKAYKAIVFSFMAVLVFSAGLFYIANTAHADPLLNAKPMTKAEATKAGYKKQVFSFSAANLDFETYIPKNADVKTLEYQATKIPEGQVGRVLPIGQMNFTENGIPFENIIFSYRLRNPPAAYRTCMWYMTGDGYNIVHSYAPKSLEQAQLLGIKLNDQGQPDTAGLAYCYARGDNLIGQYFMAKLPPSGPAAEKAVVKLRDIAANYAANMQFLDKKPIGLDDEQIENKAITIDDEKLVLSFPKALEASDTPDKVSKLPYEVYFTQNLQNGNPFSYLSFAIHPISGPNREESFRSLADAYVNSYVETQKKAGGMDPKAKTEFLDMNSIPGYASLGVGARSYQYKITSPDDPDKPTLFQISLIRDGNKLYVIYYHSLRTDSRSAGGYFTGSMGDVGYDMLRESLYNFLATNKK